MKYIICSFTILMGLLAVSFNAKAQIFDRIEDRVEDEIVNEVDDTIDDAIDKIGKGSKAKKDSTTKSAAIKHDSTTKELEKPSLADYKNYDFVPGDKIIFQSNFRNQNNAALPARLGVYAGAAAVQTYRNEKVLVVEKESDASLQPLMSTKNYLPDQFTVEFDFLYNGPISRGYHWLTVKFAGTDISNKELKFSQYGLYHFKITNAKMIEFGDGSGNSTLPEKLIQLLAIPNTWHHLAIYIHNNIGKVYIDQYRVAASNIMPKGVTKLAINTTSTERVIMIKNMRIAAGGSDAYQKIITDGKVVTHGIYFAFGKATILPESMGTINEMYHILKNHPELKLEIDGYTDNVGSNNSNLKLSKKRAAHVKAQLVKMGIDESRLTTKGLGEQDPIASNSTPKGRANNRRVEFVKK